MSARVQGTITISVVGKRSEDNRLDVSWLTRAEKLKSVERIVGNWARSGRGWWGIYVDTTTLEFDGGGKIYINNDLSKHVAQFSVQVKGEVTPPPVSVMSIVSRRR